MYGLGRLLKLFNLFEYFENTLFAVSCKINICVKTCKYFSDITWIFICIIIKVSTMGSKMNNQTGVEILSSILKRMSYSNTVLSKDDADSPGVIDVKSLHNLLLKGCLENQIIPRSSNLCLVDRELSEEISFYVKTMTNKT